MDEARVKAIPLFAGLNRKECRARAHRAPELVHPQGNAHLRGGGGADELF